MQKFDNSSLDSVPSEEKEFLYSTRKPERDTEIGCIGYLRADFGRGGNEFWSTWTDHCKELKTQAFKDELDTLINNLRDGGILENRAAMSAYCYKNHQSTLIDGRGSHAFKIKTDSHIFYLRCNDSPGDYNLYCYAYERSRIEKCMPSISDEKTTLAERLEEGKRKAAEQNKPDTKNNSKKREDIE